MRRVMSRIFLFGGARRVAGGVAHDASPRGKGSMGCVRSGNGAEHNDEPRNAADAVHQRRADGAQHVAASDHDGAGSAAVGAAPEH